MLPGKLPAFPSIIFFFFFTLGLSNLYRKRNADIRKTKEKDDDGYESTCKIPGEEDPVPHQPTFQSVRPPLIQFRSFLSSRPCDCPLFFPSLFKSRCLGSVALVS
ncbi:hypothetical protein QBC45DRAFT_36997 [Copromyces sp. CBS 386.78]|nr:hypothetical protein QBC45DRAFT_36997 [Copromyces sp. CBS 386.78]